MNYDWCGRQTPPLVNRHVLFLRVLSVRFGRITTRFSAAVVTCSSCVPSEQVIFISQPVFLPCHDLFSNLLLPEMGLLLFRLRI